MAEELVWGRGQGCDFVTQSCLQIITDQFQQKYEMFICIIAHVDLIDPLYLLPAACMLKFSTCNNDKAIIICLLLERFHYTGWHDDGLCCLMELYNTISLLLCKCTCGSLAMELISYPYCSGANGVFPFCNEAGHLGCTVDRLSVAQCNLVTPAAPLL